MTNDLNDDDRPSAATTTGSWISATQVAGLASLGAGAIHAAAIGIHAEHTTLSRLFVAVAAAQLAVGVVVLVRGGRVAAGATALVNAGAVIAWVLTRTTGISWIEGLEQSEAPQFTDTVCAALGGLAVVASVVAIWSGRTRPAGARLGLPAVALGALTVGAMMYGATHVHSHGDGHDASAAAAGAEQSHGDEATTADPGHSHGDEATTADPGHTHTDDATTAGAEHTHTDDATTAGAAHAHGDEGTAAGAEPAAAAWPRPWDPAEPIDLSGVPGVSARQQQRAERLIARTLKVLPKKYSDVTALEGLGYHSIGDASTGFEHYINIGYIVDDHFLDPNHPESLVYRVDGDERTLVSAMYIAEETPLDDPELVGWGGPLMQWHVHLNLCWGLNDEGVPAVVAVTDDHGGTCPAGTVNAGGENPMVHVWVAPHECGPFAALEGHGAGQADPATGVRVDQCAAGHAHGDAATGQAASETRPYDPTQPIDLGGVDGVTPEQQAFAENLVATNLVRLPQWSDPAVAEAAGFHSIGDAATGHEHYIQWDWINDDVYLDPDAPESLVYEPQPDGSKKLVSAMYMLPDDTTLDEVPDWGGQLMQWHVHNDLCFTADPIAPQVAGLRTPNGPCSPPTVALAESPMIHVWITPHQCGPFAALEGVGAGAIKPGQERWCDHAHGS
jgi:hypothetical protein